MIESEGHFILHYPKYDSLRNKGKFITETVQELSKGTAAVMHILSSQTKQYCNRFRHFIDDALNTRKSCINIQVPVRILYYIVTNMSF